MPRPEFSLPGTKGKDNTVTVQNRPLLTSASKSDTSEVGAGGTSAVDFYAGEGEVYRPMNAYFNVSAVDAATSGIHEFKPFSQTIASLRGASSYSSSLTFDVSTWTSADDAQQPANEGAIAAVIRSLRATATTPITVNYNNNTDAAHSQERRMKFSFEVTNYE